MKVQDVLELPFQEHPSLLQGSSAITQPLDPNSTATPHCQHDAAFFANPDYEAILAQQSWEITERELQAAQPEDGTEPDTE